LKKCLRCGEKKDEAGFPAKNQGRNRNICRTCHKRIKRAKFKAWLKDYCSRLSCIVCGFNHPACLDFHHRDTSTKKKEVSRIVSDNSTMKQLKEEIDKCDVLCANCHRIKHWEEYKIVEQNRILSEGLYVP
jgi:hypothetical protein